MYTIYYERDGSEHQVPVVFAEKLPAMENACEMLRLEHMRGKWNRKGIPKGGEF